MSYSYDFERHKKLSHKQSVLFYGPLYFLEIILSFKDELVIFREKCFELNYASNFEKTAL